MNRIILLDFGSGETNVDMQDTTKMLDDIVRYKLLNNNGNRVIAKFQLFNNDSVPGLKRLTHKAYKDMAVECKARGIECTASVFDNESGRA
jgi:hypothetical protein